MSFSMGNGPYKQRIGSIRRIRRIRCWYLAGQEDGYRTQATFFDSSFSFRLGVVVVVVVVVVEVIVILFIFFIFFVFFTTVFACVPLWWFLLLVVVAVASITTAR